MSIDSTLTNPDRLDMVSVLVDMLYVKADVRELVEEIAARWPCEPRTAWDGCEGESLASALDGHSYVVVYENYDDSEGYGHHQANAIIVRADGKIVHASCGGCSCEGHGGWSFEDDVGDAWRMVPEQERE